MDVFPPVIIKQAYINVHLCGIMNACNCTNCMLGYELLYSRFKYRNLISNYLKNVAIGLDFSD